MARGEPTPGEIQAHFASVVERGALVVSRYSGADATDPLGSISSRNSAGEDCASGDDSDSYALDVTTLTEGGIVYLALGTGDVEHQTASGLFGRMRVAQGSGPAASVEVHDRAEDAGEHGVTGGFTGSVDWTAVAMEIRSRHVDEGLRSTASLDVRPNPFNSTAHIGYTLYRRAHVELSIFDARGLLVRRLWKGGVAPGHLQLEWDARDDRGLPVQSGVYFLRLQSDGRTLARKVVLLK